MAKFKCIIAIVIGWRTQTYFPNVYHKTGFQWDRSPIPSPFPRNGKWILACNSPSSSTQSSVRRNFWSSNLSRCIYSWEVHGVAGVMKWRRGKGLSCLGSPFLTWMKDDEEWGGNTEWWIIKVDYKRMRWVTVWTAHSPVFVYIRGFDN